MLRMALDDVRRGARRVLTVPARPGGAFAMRSEAEAVGAALDLRVLRVSRPPGSRSADLPRAVLRLLLDRGPAVGKVVERHGLQRGLPLALLGGTPVWDALDRGAEGSVPRPGLARGIGEFLLESARRRTLVLAVDRQALSDPLAAAVVAHLERAATGSHRVRGGEGGLLLLLERKEKGPGSVVPIRAPA